MQFHCIFFRKWSHLLLIGLAFIVTHATALKFEQNFDGLANGLSNRLLADGSRITGSAFVNDSALVLTRAQMSQTGQFHVPALNGSARGWTANFSLRIEAYTDVTPPADGFSLVWGNVFGVKITRDLNVLASNSTFVARNINTFFNKGFHYLTNANNAAPIQSTGGNVLNSIDRRNATVSVSWEPQGTMKFLTTGFVTNANMVGKLSTSFAGSDAFTWSFGADSAAFFEFVAIDNIAIEAPCNECMAASGQCSWTAQAVCVHIAHTSPNAAAHASPDATTHASPDATTHTSPDATADASPDASPNARAHTGTDTGTDTRADAGTDTAANTVTNTRTDTRTNTRTDTVANTRTDTSTNTSADARAYADANIDIDRRDEQQ
jgi:hypothetical protein